ncbi:MAG: hypothetical protein KDK34_04070 [Leptospiraceae bacterium]|nr:hypothetical protein [Leptospiraceae bacterium]MCB1319403.1 hypothetical protein [Leptospiraceae bacterium]
MSATEDRTPTAIAADSIPWTYSLIPESGFLDGVGRVFDIMGTLPHYNFSDTEEEADNLAIYSDWAAIGQDFRNAIMNLSRMHRVYDQEFSEK